MRFSTTEAVLSESIKAVRANVWLVTELPLSLGVPSDPRFVVHYGHHRYLPILD